MTNLAKLIAACLLAIVAASAPGRAGADPPQQLQAARVVARTLLQDAYGVMSAPDLDATARFARLTDTVSDAFAFDIWERDLVGDRNLTPAQLAEFRSLLPGFLARLFADQLGRGVESGLTTAPQISGARILRRDVMVAAAIARVDAKPLPVEYRIRDFAGRGPRIIDIMIGGISFLVLKRDEFKSLIDSQGAEGLLAFMRENAS